MRPTECAIRLAQVTALLITASTQTAVFAAITRLTGVVAAHRTTLALKATDWQVLETTANPSLLEPGMRQRLLEQTTLADGPVSLPDLTGFGGQPGASWLGLPLRAGRRSLGVLALEFREARPFPEELIGCMTLLAEHVSLKLDQLQRLQTQEAAREERLRQLEQAALEDALTGLRNRRAFDEELERLVPLARRHGHGFAIGIVDLDGLKRVNDREGHERGNALLRGFAQALDHRLRRGDTLYRLGGDEFALILPEFDMHAANRIQMLLEEVVQELRGQGFHRVGASFGLAHHAEGESINDVLDLADKRMYRQKTVRRAAFRDATHLEQTSDN